MDRRGGEAAPHRALGTAAGTEPGTTLVDPVDDLDQVPATLRGDPERSLWKRLESEFMSGGAGSVSSYLAAQFDQIGNRLRTGLGAVKDSAGLGG